MSEHMQRNTAVEWLQEQRYGNEYIDEAEHQDSNYWDGFDSLDDLQEDYRTFTVHHVEAEHDFECQINDKSLFIEHTVMGDDWMVDHRYTLGYSDEAAWPEYFKQGGETERGSLEELPEWTVAYIEARLDVEVEER